MKQVILCALPALLICTSVAGGDTPGVSRRGQHGTVKLDHLVAGHLAELNDRYRLRVTEGTCDPAGSIGEHHHVGPGIRCVTAGELNYEQADRPTVYRAGDGFFESGDASHTAHNRTGQPTVLLNFELLPPQWSASSAIPVPM